MRRIALAKLPSDDRYPALPLCVDLIWPARRRPPVIAGGGDWPTRPEDDQDGAYCGSNGGQGITIDAVGGGYAQRSGGVEDGFGGEGEHRRRRMEAVCRAAAVT